MDTDFKIAKARAQIVMDHPFVASILLRHPIKPREDIPTLAVDGRGQIYYNPKFVDGLTVPQLVWGLSHEVLHRVGQHASRMQGRDHGGWNWAADAWINDTLDAANIGTRIDNCVNRAGSKDETVENIYATIPPGDKGGGSGQGGGSGSPLAGDGLGDDLLDEEQPQTESERKEQEAQVKLEVAEAAQVAKARGKLSAPLAKIAAAIIDVKTPWYEILERHMTGFVRGDYSWRRPNRRHIGNDIYLPSVGVVPKMGEIVCQVDVSGSVSQKELEYYGGHLKRIIEQCHPERVHVIYTDTQVQHHDTFEVDEEVKITHGAGGGTDMREGFNYIDREGIQPEVVITLTDGYTPFPDDQRYPSIWVISSDVRAPDVAGETVHFEMGER